jgi:putative transposase
MPASTSPWAWRGRWMDNVFIERLWRGLKYECVFLSAFETASEARGGIGY